MVWSEIFGPANQGVARVYQSVVAVCPMSSLFALLLVRIERHLTMHALLAQSRDYAVGVC